MKPRAKVCRKTGFNQHTQNTMYIATDDDVDDDDDSSSFFLMSIIFFQTEFFALS
jgi:hypothetical protein